MNTIDTRTAIAESDLLDALAGIVNAHLIDVEDSFGHYHPVSVTILRFMGKTGAELPNETVISVLVYVDGIIVAPYGGSTIYVNLANLSNSATSIVARAERLAEGGLARLEDEDADTVNLAGASFDVDRLNQAIAELAVEVTTTIKAQTQKGYAAAYTAFCIARNVVEDHPLSRRQYKAYILKTTGNPVPEFVKLGQGVAV